MKIIKILFFSVALLGLFAVLFSYCCNTWIKKSTASSIYTSVDEIPENNVGLLLGTVRYLHSGRENYYFRYRIRAAADLYGKGKIKHIIVSGDNHIKSYNEPEDMQAALIEAGIPPDKITLDYAGFRTLDSVVRCKKVFLQEKFTVISQEFHNQRALFIARKMGIDAVAYNAEDVGKAYGRKTMAREYLAKVKAVIDLYILGKQPRFLGETISIKID